MAKKTQAIFYTDFNELEEYQKLLSKSLNNPKQDYHTRKLWTEDMTYLPVKVGDPVSLRGVALNSYIVLPKAIPAFEEAESWVNLVVLPSLVQGT